MLVREAFSFESITKSVEINMNKNKHEALRTNKIL